jgi:anaphase-promoting complex subunit 10
LDDVGGGEDGKTLRAFLVQVRVVENHQNGKDTHVRGLKVYARDEKVRGGITRLDTLGGLGEKTKKRKKIATEDGEVFGGTESGWLTEPDWMGEPELR